MSRAVISAVWLVLLGTSLATAGDNPDAKLALHVVASSDSLGCLELAPVGCDSINVDASQEEILDADGYGYFALLAYDIDSVSGLEFAIDGWPTGRGAPSLGGPYWCEDRLSLGNHLDGGGITSFEYCVEPDSNSIATLVY